jgi:hypothetical protein
MTVVVLWIVLVVNVGIMSVLVLSCVVVDERVSQVVFSSVVR